MPPPTLRNTIRAFAELLKLNLVLMNLLTALLGFVLGARYLQLPLDWPRLTWMLLGCLLAGGGAMALNQVLEKDIDGRMQRTAKRPLPTGRVHPLAGLLFGTGLVLLGVFLIYFLVNLLAAFLMLLIAFVYVLVYTPLKQISWINTPVGAISGAVPPLVGWAAATGSVAFEAWTLFLILFLWQHPHFYALAWLYRADYARGGLQMLPVVDPEGGRTIRQILICTVLLLPASVLPFHLGLTGIVYLLGTLAIGLLFLAAAVILARSRQDHDARQLFRASLAYFPLLLLFIGLDVALR